MRRFSMIALLAAAVSAQAPETAQTEARAMLRGRVLAADRTPLAGAAVTFAAIDSLTTAALLAAPPHVTAADGTFALAVPLRDDPAAQSPPQLLVVANSHAAVALMVNWDTTLGSDGRRDRADTDVGDVPLPSGALLVGRVRGIDGAPIADAVVLGSDHLDAAPGSYAGDSNASCRAVTDRSGIFRLAGALGTAAAIDVLAPGHHRVRMAPVSTGAPLDIALQPSGFAVGRVVLADGKGLGGVHVRASYERGGPPSLDVVTADDGSFALSIERPGRYRLHAEHRRDDVAASIDLAASSKVFVDPCADLVLQLQPTINPNEILPVRAVAAADGAPIAMFRVAAVFEEFAAKNDTYLEYRMRVQLRLPQTLGRDGSAELWPTPRQRTATGTVRVVAPGFAPSTCRNVARPSGDAAPEPLVVRLEPEAILRGKVVAADSKTPVPGVAVCALVHATATSWITTDQVMWRDDGAITDKDGTFTLRGLGEGDWELHVSRHGRPLAPSHAFRLQPAEHRDDFVLALPPAVMIRGHVRGATLPCGSAIVMRNRPGVIDARGLPRQASDLLRAPPIPIATDGSYEGNDWPLGTTTAALQIPRPPRLGPPRVIELGNIDLPEGGLERDFDLPASGSTIRGRLSFSVGTLPASRLLVVAQPVIAAASPSRYSANGPRAFVGEDGGYSLTVDPGLVDVVVFDLETWLPLARRRITAVPVVTTGPQDLTLDVREITIEVASKRTGDPIATIDHLELGWLPPIDDAAPGKSAISSSGVGPTVTWPHGATKLNLMLPIGHIRISAIGGDAELQRSGRTQPRVLAREELDLAPRKQNGDRPIVVELAIDPPTATDDAPPNDRGR